MFYKDYITEHPGFIRMEIRCSAYDLIVIFAFILSTSVEMVTNHQFFAGDLKTVL